MSRTQKHRILAPLRMTYAQANTYLSTTLNTLAQQIKNGTLTTHASLTTWDAACAYVQHATSARGIPESKGSV